MKRVGFAILAGSIALSSCGGGSPAPAGSEPAEHEAAPTAATAENPHRAAPVRSVTISPQSAQAIGLTVATAGPATVREVLSLYGTIKVDTARVRTIAARYPGMVKSVTKNVGDRTQQGEALAKIESSDSLEDYVLTAPIAGVVTARMANPGETAGSEPLFTVSDFSQVWADLTLFPRDRVRVKTAQEVVIIASDGNARAPGHIALVGALGSAAEQTLLARVPLANAQGLWTPGQFVTGEVVVREESVPVAVQTEALQTLEDRTVVFVQGPEGFVPRLVTLGRQDTQTTQIVEGLAVGERYAATGSFVLKAEFGKRAVADED